MEHKFKKECSFCLTTVQYVGGVRQPISDCIVCKIKGFKNTLCDVCLEKHMKHHTKTTSYFSSNHKDIEDEYDLLRKNNGNYSSFF